MFDEFRTFILRGNVVDLAVAFIMGAAFNSIVDSMVNDIIMPPIGLLLGGMDFSNLFFALDGKEYASLATAQAAGAATINYGLFINAVLSFLIVSVVMFFIVRSFNHARAAYALAPASEDAPPTAEALLAEIRDILKAQASSTDNAPR